MCRQWVVPISPLTMNSGLYIHSLLWKLTLESVSIPALDIFRNSLIDLKSNLSAIWPKVLRAVKVYLISLSLQNWIFIFRKYFLTFLVNSLLLSSYKGDTYTSKPIEYLITSIYRSPELSSLNRSKNLRIICHY